MIELALRLGLDWLLPRRCVVCARVGTGLCGECAGRLAPPAPGLPPPGIDRVVALCDYDGVGRDLVLELKRGGRRDAVAELGMALAAGLHAVGPGTARPAARPASGRGTGSGSGSGSGLGSGSGSRDLTPTVTWAPTTPRRRRERGFDQAELLARSVARAGGWPVRRLLRRDAPAQMGLDRSHRRIGPRFVPAGAAPPVVVLVDDVVTTGSTVTAAASALRAAGAHHVVAAVIARVGQGWSS